MSPARAILWCAREGLGLAARQSLEKAPKRRCHDRACNYYHCYTENGYTQGYMGPPYGDTVKASWENGKSGREHMVELHNRGRRAYMPTCHCSTSRYKQNMGSRVYCLSVRQKALDLFGKVLQSSWCHRLCFNLFYLFVC